MGNVILGSGLSHDGSSCLMKEGLIISAIEKERITRRKHDGFNDAATIDYCLRNTGLSWEAVDLFVENLTYNAFDAEDDRRRGQRTIPPSTARVAISHHLAHAWSAFGPCPFEAAAVIVVDGRGSSLDNCNDVEGASLPVGLRSIAPGGEATWFEASSIYLSDAKGPRPILRDFSPLVEAHGSVPGSGCRMAHSLGEFYGRVAFWVFGSEFCEGKLMGLAPFGRPDVFRAEAVFVVDGHVLVDLSALDRLEHDLCGGFAARPEHFQHYADVAFWAQSELERALLSLFRHARHVTGARFVAYAGGVALNAVANGRLLREGIFDGIFIQPAAGDNGIALGCCHYGQSHVLGQPRRAEPRRSAFGRVYSEADYLDALPTSTSDEVTVERPADVAAAAAACLAAGETVGWFQGPSEFGPRALGHRSILADPRGSLTRNYINRDVKNREDFRPFAPAVCEEAAPAFFDPAPTSPHMLLVTAVRPEWRDRLPAVVHRDGSARVQTVAQASEPVFHALLQAFARLTGLPMLLNTSFNGRGMPIVETPTEALSMFMTSGLHVLVLGDRLFRKCRPPPPLLRLANDETAACGTPQAPTLSEAPPSAPLRPEEAFEG